MTDPLVVAGRAFSSRLFVGTGKYSSYPVMARALEASGCEVVTVAVRRVNISDRSKESLLDYIDPGASCRTPRAATRPTTRCGRRASDGRPASPTG
jgi:thiazole synthase